MHRRWKIERQSTRTKALIAGQRNHHQNLGCEGNFRYRVGRTEHKHTGKKEAVEGESLHFYCDLCDYSKEFRKDPQDRKFKEVKV